MTMTSHGMTRMKERTGFGKSAAKITRIAAKALVKGLSHKDTRGELRKYLDGKYESHTTGNNMRIYAGKIYVFQDDTLITVLTLPGTLQKEACRCMKKAA